MKKSSMSSFYQIEVEGGEEPPRTLTSNLGDNRPVRSHVRDIEVTMRSHVNGGGKDGKSAGAKKTESRSEDIDECAEAFIRRFRQQLQIQRLESIENYEKMLARGL